MEPNLVRRLEFFAGFAVVLVALAAAYRVFIVRPEPAGGSQFAQFQQRATVLENEADPIKRDSMCIPLSAMGRSIDAQIPNTARVYVDGMLGPENGGKMGYFYFLNYYLFPREVALSLGQPPAFVMPGVMQGHNPASLDEVTKAGYDLYLKPTDTQWETHALKQLPAIQPQAKPISGSDSLLAFLLPLAVAVAGTRLIRLLFKDLEAVLSLGEKLACGLALALFFLTQGILGLRIAGARLEQVLGIAVMIWALMEAMLLVRQLRTQRPQFDTRAFWWLLLLPALLMLWCLFRLAGTEGLQEFDAVAFWAFKAKVLNHAAGAELWTWFKNPTLGFAHLDYPLTVPLMHAFTYGLLGHVNEFVTKFWNQWMLLLLGVAILGAGKFPHKQPWVTASLATIVVLLPLSLEFTRMEGGTIPMFFFAVISSLQLALGLAESQPARIRLGLLLLMATAMVKFEGIVLLVFWGILLLLDKDSRAAFWPVRRIGLIGLLGLAGWTPYLVFRLHHPVLHPESAWLGILLKNLGTVLAIAPMTCLAFLSRRFLNNDFVNWGASDNLHAVWQGKWAGLESLLDQATLGLGWLCLLALLLAWWQGGKMRWTVARLALIFLVFAMFISVVWSATHSEPLNYDGAIRGSERINGGRYLYGVLMSWFVASFVLLVRSAPDKPATQPTEKDKPRSSKPNRRAK